MSTILHVEDEHAVRFLYKEVFEEQGHRVVQASTAEEALLMLNGNRPDLIILDLKMPGMGGRKFLDEFHSMRLPIPVVISTAYPYDETDPIASLADAFVVKSGDMDELLDTVSKLLNKRSRV